MAAYLLKRILLIFPTLFGIMVISFAIIQFAPGGPVEYMIAKLSGMDVAATARISGTSSGDVLKPSQEALPGAEIASKYRGAQGLDPEFIQQLEKEYGFDRPAHERFFLMMKNYLMFDFGTSYHHKVPVIELIKQKLPVSISLGIWMLLITYLVSIPLGIRKAMQDGERFDTWTSGVLVLGYAIPGFLVAVFLLVMFAGGSYFQWFPLGGLTSDDWSELSLLGKVVDYFWHLALPMTAMALGTFTTLTFLTRNSFLDEIRKQYVLTAQAKGLGQRQVLYGHVFRNAMLLIVAGFPGAFIHAFFTGSLLIETIFNLDGLGLLSFESVIKRDYAVVFGSIYIFALLGLVMHLISDFAYTLIDPRIDFESREV